MENVPLCFLNMICFPLFKHSYMFRANDGNHLASNKNFQSKVEYSIMQVYSFYGFPCLHDRYYNINCIKL